MQTDVLYFEFNTLPNNYLSLLFFGFVARTDFLSRDRDFRSPQKDIVVSVFVNLAVPLNKTGRRDHRSLVGFVPIGWSIHSKEVDFQLKRALEYLASRVEARAGTTRRLMSLCRLPLSDSAGPDRLDALSLGWSLVREPERSEGPKYIKRFTSGRTSRRDECPWQFTSVDTDIQFNLLRLPRRDSAVTTNLHGHLHQFRRPGSVKSTRHTGNRYINWRDTKVKKRFYSFYYQG